MKPDDKVVSLAPRRFKDDVCNPKITPLEALQLAEEAIRNGERTANRAIVLLIEDEEGGGVGAWAAFTAGMNELERVAILHIVAHGSIGNYG